MKNNPSFILTVAFLTFLIGLNAHAHDRRYFRGGYPIVRHYHGQSSFRFYFGYPLYWPPYYAYPFYYPPYYFPPAYRAPDPPANYVQPGGPPQSRPLNPNVWHYCPESDGYYPNAPSCPGGWDELQQQPAGEEPGFWYYCNSPTGYYPYIRNCSHTWQKISP